MNKNISRLGQSYLVPFHNPAKVLCQASLERKLIFCADRVQTQLEPDQNEVTRGSKNQTHHKSVLGHTAVPFPP